MKSRRAVGGLISLIGLIAVFGVIATALILLTSEQFSLSQSQAQMNELQNEKIKETLSLEVFDCEGILNNNTHVDWIDIRIINSGAERSDLNSFILLNDLLNRNSDSKYLFTNITKKDNSIFFNKNGSDVVSPRIFGSSTVEFRINDNATIAIFDQTGQIGKATHMLAVTSKGNKLLDDFAFTSLCPSP